MSLLEKTSHPKHTMELTTMMSRKKTVNLTRDSILPFKPPEKPFLYQVLSQHDTLQYFDISRNTRHVKTYNSLNKNICNQPHFSMWSRRVLFTGILETLLITTRLTGWYFLAMNLSHTFSNTGITNDSAFHPSEVDKMSTRNFWELSGKK